MTNLFFRHLVEHLGRSRIGGAQSFGKTAVDPAVFFLVGNCQCQDFLFAEIGKALHMGLSERLANPLEIFQTRSKALRTGATKAPGLVAAEAGIVMLSWKAAQTLIEKLPRQFAHLYWRFSRGMTLGVRALV